MAKRTLEIPFSRHRLTEIRETQGLTLTALAARCTEQGYPVHLSAISKVEVGTNGPSPGLVKALATALGVDVGDLMDPKAGEPDGRVGEASIPGAVGPTGEGAGGRGSAAAAVAEGPPGGAAGAGAVRAAASAGR
ncbi:helix-turn-helix domain-containing protein [Amycolatopsis eburnea]|uniref:XRE family transcriptional regulator n=1 Tax=Amycolatopsis eburnea TaxID=2267691 RepID=A0A3R9KUB6_9PSEU|nr:helix-turn-helix transcriptional regulator [Amycolatopsis eburnea]RSD26385.1 XRE family transcriptional regulator [Amycolatopsis eburnea]